MHATHIESVFENLQMFGKSNYRPMTQYSVQICEPKYIQHNGWIRHIEQIIAHNITYINPMHQHMIPIWRDSRNKIRCRLNNPIVRIISYYLFLWIEHIDVIFLILFGDGSNHVYENLGFGIQLFEILRGINDEL